MPDELKPKIELESKPHSKPLGWVVCETVGKAVVNPVLLLPEEERKRRIEEMNERHRLLQEYGEPAVPGAPYVCPNGCAGPFRIHGKTTTMVGYVCGLDPNHWKESCSCEVCGARFTKEWVWANDYGRPWYSMWENGRQVVYHGAPTCCEETYTRREPK